MRNQNLKRTSIRTMFDVAVTAAIVAVFVAIAGFAMGVRVVPVMSGSMEPTYGTGSLVLTVKTSTNSVRAGDVIAFLPPNEFSTPGHRPVMHRVVTATDAGGSVQLQTKGDANALPDPWTLDVRAAETQKAVFGVPLVGRVVAAMSGPNLSAKAATIFGMALLLAAIVAWPKRSRHEGCTCSSSLLAAD